MTAHSHTHHFCPSATLQPSGNTSTQYDCAQSHTSLQHSGTNHHCQTKTHICEPEKNQTKQDSSINTNGLHTVPTSFQDSEVNHQHKPYNYMSGKDTQVGLKASNEWRHFHLQALYRGPISIYRSTFFLSDLSSVRVQSFRFASHQRVSH